MNSRNSAPTMPRVLSVHNRISATNIPLEAFAHWAALADTRQRFECAVMSLYGNAVTTRREYASMYDESAVNVMSVNWGWKRPWRAFAVARFLREWSPDVVHVHHASSAALVSTLAKRYTRARVITTLHRDVRTLAKQQKWMLGRAIGQSDLVLCNSLSTWKAAQAFAGQTDLPETRVIYNGIDLRKIDRMRNTGPLRGDSQVMRVGAVGRLIPIKGFETLLEAVAAIYQQGRAVELVLIGDGPLRRDLFHKTQQLGIEGITTFTGSIQREDVYQQLHTLDVFVASSYSEGFCNGMVEAMGAGCPVVATDIPVFQEILGSDYPLFFTAGSAKQLSDRLQHCFAASAWRQQLGQQLRVRAIHNFSLDACASKHGEVYQWTAHGETNNEPHSTELDSPHRIAA